MSDLLARGQAWLSQQLTRHASRKVIYRRGQLGVELSATIGKSEYDQDSSDGLITRSQVRDYLINTDELLQSIIATLPKRGDQIVELENNQTFVFEVMALGSEPPWRYSDPFRNKIRVHTKQIAS